MNRIIAHNGRLILVLGFLIFNTVMNAVGLYALQYQTERSDAKICATSNAARQSLRDLLLRAQEATTSNPDATDKQKQQAREFYADTLSRVKIIECPPGPHLPIFGKDV